MVHYRNALVLVLTLAVSTVASDTEVRGITISTHGIGRDWGTDAIVPTLEDIRAVGANWVAIHPYASIRADGSLRWSDIDPDDPPAHIVRPIREAHRLGLRIYIKPHIAYWRSPFSWRGEIAFAAPRIGSGSGGTIGSGSRCWPPYVGRPTASSSARNWTEC